MRHIESGYFCTSTFQLYGILSLRAMRNETADLYIDPQFKDADIIADRIRKLSLFDNVIVIDSESIYKCYYSARKGLLNHLQIARSYLFVEQIAQMILLPDTEYNSIFVSTKAYLPRMVYLSFLKNKKKTKLIYFDDGVGSYYADLAYEMKMGDAFVRAILFGKEANNIEHERFLFSPGMYKLLNPDTNYKVQGIVPYWNQENGISNLNSIFNCDTVCAITEKTIILDEPLEEVLETKSIEPIHKAYMEAVNQIGRDNVILKKHPRSKAGNDYGIKEYKMIGVPFETICMNSDLDGKILISYGSTALSTPKMLFNQEPYIVVLYNLCECNKEMDRLQHSFFSNLKKLYKDPSKVFEPENIDQLATWLKERISEENV